MYCIAWQGEMSEKKNRPTSYYGKHAVVSQNTEAIQLNPFVTANGYTQQHNYRLTNHIDSKLSDIGLRCHIRETRFQRCKEGKPWSQQ